MVLSLLMPLKNKQVTQKIGNFLTNGSVIVDEVLERMTTD